MKRVRTIELEKIEYDIPGNSYRSKVVTDTEAIKCLTTMSRQLNIDIFNLEIWYSHIKFKVKCSKDTARSICSYLLENYSHYFKNIRI